MSNKRAALYVRVSTGKQTVENQIAALTEVAARRHWQIVATFNDAGISGTKGRKDRPGFDEMLKAAQRHRFDVVMAWSIDRLGRSLGDLIATMEHLKACNVDLYLDQTNLDTTTPNGRLVFQVSGAFAEFERSLIVARVNAGLDRARANGKTLGRPTIDDPALIDQVRKELAKGIGINRIARIVGLGSGTVRRIKAEMKNAIPA